MRAVQFGAGNIGRGFLGQLFFESGYETTFVEVSASLVTAINAAGEYPVRIVSDGEEQTVMVRNVRALCAQDAEAVAEAVACADIVATAVGVSHLGEVAVPLAAGIALRLGRLDPRPLDVLLCENLLHASAFMRERVRAVLDPAYGDRLEDQVGFVEASIGRMVPVRTWDDPLLVAVEPYAGLPVDREGFRGRIPPIVNLEPKSNFAAYVERKLFVHNAGHASAAYLGYLRHHEFIWQAMVDAKVRAVVAGAMSETCEALQKKHGLSIEELQAHAQDLEQRFGNRALGDQVARVAADPIRKLGPDDRLIGGLKLCQAEGVEPVNLSLATAAALLYDAPDDPGAQELRRIWRSSGPEGVLEQVCGLSSGDPVGVLILKQAKRIRPFRM